VLAQVAGARQPQTTKHLQTLERAGAVTSRRIGQRRIYTLSALSLRQLATELTRLADAAEAAGGSHETHDRHAAAVESERRAATDEGWADGRSFGFTRSLSAEPAEVWRHLTETDLLRRWWTPDDLRVSELVFEPRTGGRIVLEYRDLEDADDSDAVAGRAEGVVQEAVPTERLTYRLSPVLPDGTAAFTSEVELHLRRAGAGTDLEVHWRIADSTVDAADFVAGIEIGFGQSLDKLAAVVADDAESTDTTEQHETQDPPRGSTT
jgi:uncharacterized protein YndB with AHSA1/START domain